MFPVASSENCINEASGNTIPACEFGLGDASACVERSNLHYLNSRQLGSTVPFTKTYLPEASSDRRHIRGVLAHAILLDSILRVVLWCANKQVAWIAARRIVTLVADKETGQYANAMRQRVGNLVRRVLLFVYAESPIPIIGPTIQPGPTDIRSARLINFTPKTLGNKVKRFNRWYTSHCQILSLGFGRAGDVNASPGLLMPNYSTNHWIG